MKGKWIGPLLLLLAAPLLAQSETGGGVARLSLINGDVTTQRGADRAAAMLNAPLVAGDRISTSRTSRAEVRFDYADFLRIGPNTEVRLTDLENRHYQVQVSKGILTYRVQRDLRADVEIDTPTVTVRPVEKGTYRVRVLDDGQTRVTVRSGKAEVSSQQQTETLKHGRTLLARTAAGGHEVEVREIKAAGKDDWDRWNESRDHQIAHAQRYGFPGVYNPYYAYGYWSPWWDPFYDPFWYSPGFYGYGYGFGGFYGGFHGGHHGGFHGGGHHR